MLAIYDNNDDSKRDVFENMNTQVKIFDNIGFINHYKDLDIMKKTLGDISLITIHDTKGNIFSREYINDCIINEIEHVIK